MSVKFSKILKFLLIFTIITGWLFSDWPIFLKYLQFPPKIEVAKAATETLRPNANGSTQSWSYSSVGNWQDTSDETTGTYVNSGTDEAVELEGLADPTFSASDTINSVTIHATCGAYNGSAAGEKASAYILSGSTYSEHSPGGSTVLDWPSTSDLTAQYTTNPDDGLAWELADVTALELGAIVKTIGSGEEIYCNEFWAVVDYTPVLPTLTQNHYRWRDDTTALNTDGGWSATEDNSYDTLLKQTTARLRMEIANTGDTTATSYQYQLEFAAKVGASCGDDETFGTVPVTATTEHFEMVDSLYTDGDNITATRLTAVGTWADGEAVEDPSNQTVSYNLTNAYYTEFEYAIQATSNATTDGTYCFQLTNSGSETNFSYSLYPEATVTAPTTTYTQNNFRFYVDNDALSPTDPWPTGGTDINENTAITTSDSPPDDTELIRLRMSVTVGGSDLATSTESFKLQYGEGSTCSGITNWLDLGDSASTTALWRGESDTNPSDGSTLTGNLLLTNSNHHQSYEEENNSVSNPKNIGVGQNGEWDWLVQNNNSFHDTSYCFRMVESDATPLGTYTNYPKISTETTTFDSTFEAGNGENFTKPYNSSSTMVSFNSELDGGGPLGPCTDWRRQNWFYFSMDNALNQAITFTLINAIASNNENTNWTDHKPVYSYDQVTWYRINDIGVLSGNDIVYTIPGGSNKFTSDTVYIAHGRPYTYTDYLSDRAVWEASSFVATTTIGTSVQGRAMDLVTIQDTNSPVTAANKQVYWLNARDHPMEPESSRMIKGAIDFLIGSSNEAELIRRTSIFKIVPMMNPDGVYLGHTTANAEYCNLNRDWDVSGANAVTETDEVYNTHYYIDDWINNGTPADIKSVASFHTRTDGPGVYDGNAAIIETPYEELFAVLDGVPHAKAFTSSGTAGMMNVSLYTQHTIDTFTVEGGTYKFGSDYPDDTNATAYGVAWLKANFAHHDNDLKVFALEQTNAGGSTDPQYLTVTAPGQYHLVFDEDKGGGIEFWWDLENDSGLTQQLVEAYTVLDKIAWQESSTYRQFHEAQNATLTMYNNSGTRVNFRYTGLLGNLTNYNYVYDRTIWEDGKICTNFNFTNNTGGDITWQSVEHVVSFDDAYTASLAFDYDNTADPPSPGTDNWWGLVGNGGSGIKATAIAHYLAQTGGWVYDDYGEATNASGIRNWYADTVGPVQSNGTSLVTNICYQIRPDSDTFGTEEQIDAYNSDLRNPDTPTMTTGTFTEFDKLEGGLEFAASSNNVKFTYTNADSYTKKKPVYVVTSYTANTAPVLKVNDAYLDSEDGSAHTTSTYIGASYTSFVDITNNIAYVQYLSDISTNISVEIKDAFATGPQTLTFSISDNSVGYGTLSSSVARYASGDGAGNGSEVVAHTLDASTNASNGYAMTVLGPTLASGANTITAIGGVAAASNPSNEQFGLKITASGGSGTVTSPYNTANFAYNGISAADEVASASSGDDVTTTYSVYYLANIASNTESGSYSTALTYVITANY